VSEPRERRAPLDLEEDDKASSVQAPETDIEDVGESIQLAFPKQALKEAIIDALRLDYEGKLAKICEDAIDDEGPRLRAFVHEIIAAVLEDEEYRESLRAMVRKRIHDRLFAKVDAHVKKTPASDLTSLLAPQDPE